MKPTDEVKVFEEKVMGTVFSFLVWPGALTDDDILTLVDRARSLLHNHDEIFTTYQPDSLIMKIQRHELPEKGISEEIDEVIDLCLAAKTLSKRWFDPWAAPNGFDPTGLVKGWSVQKAAQLIFEPGLKAVVVNGGGDICCLGEAPPQGWRFGISHPWRKDAVAAIVEVEHSVATSGRYERGEHFFDPLGFRGTPVVSATVTGPDLAFADAFATALAVGGKDAFAALQEISDYEFYMIDAQGKETSSDNFTFASDN